MGRGRFIVLEGIDGSGKTAIAEKLGKMIEEAGHVVLHTKEPTDAGRFARKIRLILGGKSPVPPPIIFRELYIKNRLEHTIQVIEPALMQGNIVLCQRYALSEFAYGMARGGSYASIQLSHDKILKNHFIQPDLTIILDVPASVAIRRINRRGKIPDLFEKKEMLSRVRTAYKRLSKRRDLGPAKLINGNRPIYVVVTHAARLIKPLLISKN